MLATELQQKQAIADHDDMAYIRQVEIGGRVEWALFDIEGAIVHHSENMSSAFFFAAAHEFRICMRN